MRSGHWPKAGARRGLTAGGIRRGNWSLNQPLRRCDNLPVMANVRLRSIGSATSPALSPLSEEEELLRKLCDGEISREDYYDTLVERGVAHLRGRIPAEQLQIVRESLREEVETSPVLAKVMRDAIAELPKSATR